MKKHKISLYAQYLKERGSYGIVECKEGFATFDYVSEDVVYLIDVYVIPEKRKSKIATNLVNEISKEAKKSGHKIMLTSADTRANGIETAIKAIEAYGFKLFKAEEPMLFFSKDIGDVDG